MKTVVIFNNFESGALTCSTLEGDFEHLHEKYLNSTMTTEEESDQIDALAKLACLQGGVKEWYVHKLPEFPNEEFYQAVKDGAKVIVTGCLP